MSLQTRLEALVAAVGADIKDLRSKVGQPVTVTQEGWHMVGAAGEPPFQNGFANQGGNTRPARFRKDPAGMVYIEADVSSSAGVTGDELIVFALPPGYRPDLRGYQIELLSAGAAGGYAYVDNGGNVVAHRGPVGTPIFIVASFWTGQTTFPAGKSLIPTVAALPAGPTDGDEVYFQTAAMRTDGVKWHLQYDAKAAGSYKWIAVGGSRFSKGPLGSITTASTPFVDLTGGPTMTVPLAGDYETVIGLFIQSNGAPANNMFANLAVGTLDTGVGIYFVSSAQWDGGGQEKTFPFTFALNSALTFVVRSSSGVSTLFKDAYMGIRPIRVG